MNNPRLLFTIVFSLFASLTTSYGFIYKEIESLSRVELQHQLKTTDLANEVDNEGDTLLHLAAENGNVMIVKEVLKHDPNAAMKTDRFNETALHNAAANGRVEIAMLLLKTAPEAFYIQGYMLGTPVCMPLDRAARNGHCALVRLLLHPGITPLHQGNPRKYCSPTTLHVAALRNDHEVIKLLISRNLVPINGVNSIRATALWDVLNRLDEKELETFRHYSSEYTAWLLIRAGCRDTTMTKEELEYFENMPMPTLPIPIGYLVNSNEHCLIQ